MAASQTPLMTSNSKTLGELRSDDAHSEAAHSGGERLDFSPESYEALTEDGPLMFDASERLSDLTPERADAALKTQGNLPGAFRIRLARSRPASQNANVLVQRRYSSRGYDIPGLKGDPYLFTFVAHNQGDVVGTLSIRLERRAEDGKGHGLSADDLYGPELTALRASGANVCEFTRLAVDLKFGSKPILAGLFHTAYLLAYRLRGYDHAVIEVNPRHVSFYERALGFHCVGPERLNTRVNAPAVLLCVPFAEIEAALKVYAGKPELAKNARAFLTHCFPSEEEAGVLARLALLNEERQD